ncbi:hypothetical protein GALL_389930 [mine drainage metagenome]|uniref:DUF3301 domain-containing protein n=1 Tax=mine drainage metagenome TaxID=410659 RepID=A0A1J5QTN5_9ZZZZ
MEIMLLIAVVVIAWFWLDSLHVRDLAVEAGRRAAEQHKLQFLDESVANSRLWFARDAAGRLRLLRTYDFEVSDTGAERLACSVTLLGRRVERIEMPPYRDNVVYLH